ncbi:tyrosine-protein phosphatase [Frigidibacter sp. SD6-1]|uniref:tyrosine-protein phosphatase n=1 Tax=Frigidibacter sp. SD6-1 TaxID=3032581 RepID=UPI0024DFCE4A|nr:tyrosine-protein phosphatase [Frigidibacter sp. SD6-1]
MTEQGKIALAEGHNGAASADAPIRQMIGFEGLVNCRDVGGLPLEQGGVTRYGVLYRSETPQLMTPSDVRRACEDLGIGRVIDLRGARFQDRDLGGSGPIGADSRGVNIDFLELAGGIDAMDPSPDGFLPSLLDCGARPLTAFLASFAGTMTPVLVHCHTGKDRTGFIIALTLALSGVRDRDIVADYVMSVPIFDRMMANLEAAGMPVPPQAPAYARDKPSATGITAMLDRLRAEWSTPQAWARDHGIDDDLIAMARARLTGAPAL